MASRISADERITNLLIALMATEIGLTKAQILESVSGYRQRQEAGSSAVSLDKMFERDKDELRRLGVPVEVIPSPSDPQDLRDARYRIPQAEYVLPESLDFSAEELALLNLAGAAWSEGTQSDAAQAGLRKIRALGIDVDEPILGFAPRLEMPDACFSVLQAAIEECRSVAFSYHKPGEAAPLLRRVHPLALVDFESRWHLYSYDIEREQPRTFLLSRITGHVHTLPDTFDPSLREDAGERGLAGLRETAQRQRAIIDVSPVTEAALRLTRRAVEGRERLIVPFVDAEIFADELASYGPEVRVVAPDALVSLVRSRLERVEETHTPAQESQ